MCRTKSRCCFLYRPAYQSGADTGALVNATQAQPGGLVEADLNDPNIWKQLARFTAATSAGKFLAQGVPGMSGGAGAGAGGGGASSAAGYPTLGAPTLTGLPMGAGAGAGSAVGAVAGGGMGFSDILKKIGGITGLAQNLGSTFGGAAQQKADTEQNQALLDTTRNSQLLNQYGTQQGAEMQAGALDLNRKQQDVSQEGQLMKRAIIAALLGQVGSAPNGKFSIGAAAPIAAQMGQRAAQQAVTPNQYQGGNVLAPPTLSTPRAGSGSGFLNDMALFASLLGAGNAKAPDLTKKQ